jgi:hypothetical protein
MFQVSVNDKKFEILTDGDEITIDGQPLNWDVVKISDGYFHIIHNHQSYRAEIVNLDAASKTFT